MAQKARTELQEDKLIAKLRDFIETYYMEDLLNIIRRGGLSLSVDFSDLSKFNVKIADTLLNEPDRILRPFEEAIKEVEAAEDFEVSESKKITVRIVNLPKSATVRIRDIRSQHLGKLICINGLIRQTSDIRPKVVSTTFECGCGYTIPIIQTGSKLSKPDRCPGCAKKSKFTILDQKLMDMQRLVVEESPEVLTGGEQPKKISAFLSGDLLEPKIEKRRYPGNKIKIVGVVKEVPIPLRTGGQSTKYDLLIDSNSVEVIEEEFEEITITKQEEEMIKELAKDPKIYPKLISSIAPSIWGYEDVKEAIVLQLFGGAKKERKDGTRTRGDIHLFLVGDPGSGKSEILKYVSTLAPKARYISGKGATGAGLTATVVKDEFMRGWALEAGTLVLANKGICCIDEVDKMSPEDRSAMHEALEQQVISISKANVQATLRAETAVLAAANPKLGRFDPYSPIPTQIDLPSTLINRFDLIFPIQDIPNAKKDEKIAKHVLDLQRDIESKQPDIEPTIMRKYIAYAKQNCFPKLTLGAQQEIQKFYVDLRAAAAAEGEVKAVPISARQLQALVRMAEASARIRLSDKVTKKDAERAIQLLKVCMQNVGTDPETGKFDIDRMVSGISATQRSRIVTINKILEELETRFGKKIPLTEILNEADEQGIEKAKAEEVIQKMLKDGELFEPKPGLIQKMRR